MQRRMVDFGVDESFEKACDKMREHYSVIIPPSSMRIKTLRHGEEMRDNERLESEIPEEGGVDCLISETDGTMVPIVDTFEKADDDGNPIDKRKTRKVRWKEGRLSLSHPKGSVSPTYGATLGDQDLTGDHLLNCTILAGMDQNSKVHCVGDGAPWIYDQVDRVFATQADFLIDFYHLCDYLSAASKICAPDKFSVWMEEQKKRMKQNKVSEVIEALQPHIEPDSVPSKDAPVRRCYCYITNRHSQFDYKGALENGLPIGSGEIESAHRYVIQKRLKIAGAWWKEENAHNMLAIRTLRANKDWDEYWANYCKKAA